jgi:hypothetical protein
MRFLFSSFLAPGGPARSAPLYPGSPAGQTPKDALEIVDRRRSGWNATSSRVT